MEPMWKVVSPQVKHREECVTITFNVLHISRYSKLIIYIFYFIRGMHACYIYASSSKKKKKKKKKKKNTSSESKDFKHLHLNSPMLFALHFLLHSTRSFPRVCRCKREAKQLTSCSCRVSELVLHEKLWQRLWRGGGVGF